MSVKAAEKKAINSIGKPKRYHALEAEKKLAKMTISDFIERHRENFRSKNPNIVKGGE